MNVIPRSNQAPNQVGNDIYSLTQATSPVILICPRVGGSLPDGYRYHHGLSAADLVALHPDRELETLCHFAPAFGIGTMTSRTDSNVCDLMRLPQDMAICASHYGDKPLWEQDFLPTRQRNALMVERYYSPFHRRLNTELRAIRARYGFAVAFLVYGMTREGDDGVDLTLSSSPNQCHPDLAADITAILTRVQGFRSTIFIDKDHDFFAPHTVPHEGIHGISLGIAADLFQNNAPTYQSVRLILEAIADHLIRWKPVA